MKSWSEIVSICLYIIVTFPVEITSTKVVNNQIFLIRCHPNSSELTSAVESTSTRNLPHMIRYVESRDKKGCVT